MITDETLAFEYIMRSAENYKYIKDNIERIYNDEEIEHKEYAVACIIRNFFMYDIEQEELEDIFPGFNSFVLNGIDWKKVARMIITASN